MKEYTINTDVTPLSADKNLGDQFYLEQITFICEIIHERNQNKRICFNSKWPIVATCPHCSQLR